MDKGHVYIALVDWDSPFMLCNAYPNYNSYAFNLFDKNDPSVIAYGDFVAIGETEGDGMHSFEINLEYNYT
ncbi:MAG: PCMD domain-containing protein, partial [Tannerellaceae bacterium]|nr:PCMD domain-containing protein [Tannerellaceae bacterium]